ncbi:YqeB [Streptomyces xiamenensis]|uniref:YqeB n=1 Tax=Streptomyces xiamenensis TaxID=408015 RepID=A0A0F7FWG1_9ACTN|nr:YqeB [Streptomyces xiamenensis]
MGVDETTTKLGFPRGELRLILLGFPALGLALAWLLPGAARWATETLPWMPFEGPLTFVAGLDQLWQRALFLAVGVVAGLVVAFIAVAESMKLTLTDDELTVERDDTTHRFARADISAVFPDGKELVVLDRTTRPLIRGEHQAPLAAVAAAFQRHGYPWSKADPHAADFRRWVPHAPELPAEVHVVFAARKEARRRDAKEEARDLTETLGQLGYVVRDHEGQQHWRAVPG